MNILEVDHLCHRFADGTLGVDNICLTIAKGSFSVLAGPNGSGKTTFLRHLNGLLTPTSGEVRVKGRSVLENPRRARRLVGMVFQDADAQIVGETVYDDVAFGPENLKFPREDIHQRTVEAMDAMGLSAMAGRRTHLLSGGEKRRLAIAGILAMGSEVVVLDEPFSNLDYPGVQQTLRAILDIHARGKTILLTTHDLEKVITHADRLLIMEKGRLAADGPPEIVLPRTEPFGVRRPCALRWGKTVESWLS